MGTIEDHICGSRGSRGKYIEQEVKSREREIMRESQEFGGWTQEA